MPKLVKFLMFHAAIGFALALMAVVSILAFNVANMYDLIMFSDYKWIAITALTVLMTITLASVQMGIAIMCLPYQNDEDDDDRQGGTRAANTEAMMSAPIAASARNRPRR